MPIPIRCPNCQFSFRASSAGTRKQCPACGHICSAELPAVPAGSPSRASLPPPSTSIRRKPLIIAAVLALVILIVGSVLLLSRAPRGRMLREIPFAKRANYVRTLAADISDAGSRHNLLALLDRFEKNPATRSLATPRTQNSDPILAAMENADALLGTDREAAIRSLDTALAALKQMEPRQRPAGNVTRARAGYAGPLAILYVRAGADDRALEAQSLTNQPRETTAPFDSTLSQGLREKDFALALAATRGIKRDDSFSRHLLEIGVQALLAGETQIADEALAAARAAQVPIPNGDTHLEAELPMLYRLCIAGRGGAVCEWLKKRELPRGNVASIFPLWTILRISGDDAGASRLLAQCSSSLAAFVERPNARGSAIVSQLFQSFRLIAETQVELGQTDAAAVTVQSLQALISRSDAADPTSLPVLERRAGLAALYARIGNSTQANALLASMIQETEKLPETSRSSAYGFLAEAQTRVGDLPGALATLKKASITPASGPRQPMSNPLGAAYGQLALAHWKAGNAVAAADAFEKALDFQFPPPPASTAIRPDNTSVPPAVTSRPSSTSPARGFSPPPGFPQGFAPSRGRQGGNNFNQAGGEPRQPPMSIPLLPDFHPVGYALSFTPDTESLLKAADRIRDSHSSDRWTTFANLTLGVAARGDLPTALTLWQRFPLTPRWAARTGLLEVAARRGNVDLVIQHIDSQDSDIIQPLVQGRLGMGDLTGAARIYEAAFAAEPGKNPRRTVQLILECATTASPEVALRAAQSVPAFDPAIMAQLQLLAGKLDTARATAKSLPEGPARNLALQRLAHQSLQPTRILPQP